MFHIYISRFFSLFVSISLFVGSLPLSAMSHDLVLNISEQEIDIIAQNPDVSYVYLGKDFSNIAEVISRISDLDDQVDSPLLELKEHIAQGFCLAEQSAVTEALKYAVTVLQNNYKKLDGEFAEKIVTDLDEIIYHTEQGSLLANKSCCITTPTHGLRTLIVNENLDVLGKTVLRKHLHTKQGVHIDGKLKVGKKAKFKDKVTFKKGVCIEGLLSVGDTILSDLTINGNVTISAFTTPGVIHNDASGLLSSSLVVDVDIAPATITNAKLANISSANIPGNIVVRDNFGNFATNMITLDGITTNPTDAATKAYVDSVASAGLVPKTPAVVVSLANEVLNGFPTIDGVVFPSGTNRILLTGQANPIENGLWIAQAGAWIRPADFATGTAAEDAFVLILSGVINGGSGWLCSTPSAVIDTDPIEFILFSLADTTTGANVGAGTGLIFRDKTGNFINFKSLIQGSHVVLTNNANDITLATDAVSANTANTIVARDASGNFATNMVTLAGTTTNATDAATKAYVDSVASTTTGANVGAGTGLIFRDKTGSDINFKSLIQSSHVVLTNNANDITVATDAVSANTANAIVARDASGRFSAGAISVTDEAISSSLTIAPFSTAGIVHNNASGLLSSSLIVNADVDAAAAIVDSKLATISTAGKVANSATTATSANTPNTIVLRDGSGNFATNMVTLAGTTTNATDAATKAYVDSVASTTTGANVGAGTGLIFRDKTGSNINFKSLIQGSHVVLINNANDITLATDATNLNIVTTIVARDAVGNFSASIVSMTDGIASGNLVLSANPSTSTTGNILKGGSRFIHNFGTDNTFVGINAGTFITSGTGQNSAFGLNALGSITTGSNNIAIGYQTGQTLSVGSGNIYINAAAGSTGENSTTRIGTSQTACFVAGIDAVGVSGNGVVVDGNGQLGITLSSRKFKHDIKDMGSLSANIFKLRPVTFAYNNDATDTQQFGLIAEEVDELFPAIVAKNEEGVPYTIRYHLLPVLLLNELQKQNAIIEQQQATIEEMQVLHVTVQEMNSAIERLRQEIQKYIIATIA